LAGPGDGELVFVVDVTSFTESGFVGTSSYNGERVDIDFDTEGEGVFLTSEMSKRVGSKKGEPVSVIVEDKVHTLSRTKSGGSGMRVRISDEKVYYAVGREGGAILRIRKTLLEHRVAV